MAERFVVSTECPTCGAPLDFSEGSNAINCGHCRSNLLVTGRKQVLSYWIPPKLAGPTAVQIARFAEPHAAGPVRATDVKLYLVPYYRLTGHDFRWTRERVKPEPDSAIPFRPMGEGSAGVDFSSLSIAFGAEREEVRFQDRHVEKNFIACDLQAFGPYSLGVRPSVLRLELFRRSRVEALGRVVAPDVDPGPAMEHAMKSAGTHRVLLRQVIGRVLSIIYFPFWIVTIERRDGRTLTVLDGISEKVVAKDVPAGILARLDRPAGAEPPTAGFRPLACPNCGWDLPVNPNDVVFFCASCERAWRLEGARLHDTRYEIAEVAGSGGAEHHLPFWVLEGRTPDGGRRRFFLPAFRYRRLKILNDLATNLARTQPSWKKASGKAPALRGCYFDPEDARALARFVCAGLGSREIDELERFRPEDVDPGEPTLAWIPFREAPHSLVDPFMGTALPRNLLGV
ncbi:MAG: hypothetical protein ACREQY_20410 [Candidatus Binatia bacterium]